MALGELRTAIATMHDLFVCGDCAKRLLAKGYKPSIVTDEHGVPQRREDGRPVVPSIGLGDECECHPRGMVRLQATTVIVAPEAECTLPVTLGELDGAALASTPPEGIPSLEPAAGEVVRLVPPVKPASPLEEIRDQAAAMAGGMSSVLAEAMSGIPCAPPSVTEIATRLVVAWSTEDRCADDSMIDAAIAVARKLAQRGR
jgi:hypothetical protein